MNTNHNRIKVADLETNQDNKILTTNNKGELEFSDISNILINDLTTGGTTKALTAEMGKSLHSNKVEKVNGKSLLSDIEITRLETLSNYTHPATHPAAIIIQDLNYRFVTDTEKATWDAKQTNITAGTNAQYFRGDKTWQALDKTVIGLSNLDNTSDLNKPVSAATQAIFDLKANLTSPSLTGIPTAPTPVVGTNTTQVATTAFVIASVEPTQITITTSVSITTDTLDANSKKQTGKNIIINNGSSAINITVNGGTDFCASYLKHGTGTITFVQAAGRTLVQVDATTILKGAVGSTATISSIGTTDYLRISNV